MSPKQIFGKIAPRWFVEAVAAHTAKGALTKVENIITTYGGKGVDDPDYLAGLGGKPRKQTEQPSLLELGLSHRLEVLTYTLESFEAGHPTHAFGAAARTIICKELSARKVRTEVLIDVLRDKSTP